MIDHQLAKARAVRNLIRKRKGKTDELWERELAEHKAARLSNPKPVTLPRVLWLERPDP